MRKTLFQKFANFDVLLEHASKVLAVGKPL
jgi:hypothetical protein